MTRTIAPLLGLIVLVGATVGGVSAAAERSSAGAHYDRPLGPMGSADAQIAGYLEELGFTPAEIDFLVEVANQDGNRDFFSPFGRDLQAQPAPADLVGSVTFEVMLTEEWVERVESGQLLDHESVIVGDFVESPWPAPGEYYVYVKAFPEPIQQREDVLFEVGVSYYDETPLNGEPPQRWVAGEQFPNDFFQGHNTAYSFRFEPPPGEVALARRGYAPSAGRFVEEPTSAFAYYSGNVIGGFIPADEWEGAIDGRLFSFWVDLAEGVEAADTWPDIDEPAQMYDPDDIPQLQLPPAPTPEPTPTPAPTPTQPSTPTRTAEATPSPDTSPAVEVPPASDEGSLLVWLALLFIGALLAAFAFWLLLWRGRRLPPEPAPPGTTTGPPYGPTRERGRPAAPEGGAAVPAGGAALHDACDWSAYYIAATGKVTVLRKADGHECCIYRVELATTVQRNRLTARGRQAQDLLGGREEAPEGRLRIPEYSVIPDGLKLWADAGARSGPAGRQDWMHGYGDRRPREPGQPAVEVEPYDQQRTHEEPPDVAARVDYIERTRLMIGLQSACPGHVNTFGSRGSSDATLSADQECTNHPDGPCPVELTALGTMSTWLAGELDYGAAHAIGGDIDEIERGPARLSGEEAAPRLTREQVSMGTFDQHLHPARPRDHYEGKSSGAQTRVRKGDSLILDIWNAAELDAGSIVPVAVWPSTERVTAAVDGEIDHRVSVHAKMDRTDCLNGPCTDADVCRCEPKLEVVLGWSAIITVDGRDFEFARPSASPGRAGTTVSWDPV